MRDETSLAQPSRFWERLGAQHAQELHEFGFEACKRHQALRYFTWTWRWDRLIESEQMRFLLSHLSPSIWLHCAAEQAELSDAAWKGVPWSRRDRWLYTFAVRLVWEYARSQDRIGVLGFAEPELGTPLPVYWRGRLISQDLANASLEAGSIVRALEQRAPRSIVEIGAGYGRTASVLLRLFPDARYTIIDIDPALSLSRWYLTQLFDPARLHFVSPAELDQLPRASADLGVSVSSLQEMTPVQVSGYLAVLDNVVSGGVVYLKQRARWHNVDDNVTLNFDSYPIPTHWHKLFRRSAPVQTSFGEAAWRL